MDLVVSMDWMISVEWVVWGTQVDYFTGSTVLCHAQATEN